MTRSGAIPYSPSRRVSAMSTVSTAGCWISVRRSSSSARAIAAGSAGSAKMMSDSRRPSSSGAMIASASSNSSATTGSRRRSSASMFAYCEPWPVYRNATLPGRRCRGRCRARAAPARRRGCPPAARAARAPPWPPGRGRRRSRSRSARARAARRCSAAVGSRWRPWRASASAVRSALASPASSAAPSTSAPRSGGLRRRAGPRAARACRGAGVGRRRHRDRGAMAVGAVTAGHVLLHDEVEVGAAEAERAHAGDPRPVARRPPSRAARC